MTVEAALKHRIITPEQLASRVQAYALEQGIPLEQAQQDIGKLVIRARRFSEKTQDGQFRHTVQLFKGANVMDVFEEFSEDSFTRALDDGFANGADLVADIRRFEDATGQQLLKSDYRYDGTNRMPLLEALSSLSRAHVLGSVRSGSLPGAVARWVELHTTLYSQTLRAARNIGSDITRAGLLRDAIASGNVSPQLQKLIADSVGIDPESIQRRLENPRTDAPVNFVKDSSFSIGPADFGDLPGTPLQQAEKFLRNLSGKDIVTADGITASLSNKTAAKMTSWKAVQKSISSDAHLAAIANLEDLFKLGRLVEASPDKNNDPNIRSILRIVSPFNYEGRPMHAKFTVKELIHPDLNRIYSIEAIDIETLNTKDAAERKWTASSSEETGLTSAPQSAALEDNTADDPLGQDSFSLGKSTNILQHPTLTTKPNSHDYRPANTPSIRIREALESLSRDFGGRVPEAAYSEGFQTIVRDFEQTTGLTVIPFIDPTWNDLGPDAVAHFGVVHPDTPWAIFVSTRGDIPTNSLLAHEWLHNLSHGRENLL